MHISNLVNQYQRNTNSNSTEELKGATSMQKLVSAVSELTQGSVFEGTVTSVRGGKVTLSLSTGQSIVAQLEGRVQLKVGTPMFFQVKSNSGNMLAIKPYTGNGSGGNPILMNALTTAGVPVTERNLEMVKAMMHQQMPIDKQSILEMIKHVSANEQTNVQTIVDMVRLGLPVDAELAAQFEQYGKGDYALLGKMDSAVDQVLNLLGSEEVYSEKAVELHHKLVDMILNPETAMQSATDDVEQLMFGTEQAVNGKDAVLNMLLGNSEQAGVTIELHTQGQNGEGQTALSQQTLAQVFSGEQLEQITKMLQSTPTLVDNPTLFITETGEEIFVDTMQEEGAPVAATEAEAEDQVVEAKQVLNTELTIEKFLKAIQQGLMNKQEFGYWGVQKLFGSKEYQTVLKELMQEQWLVSPEELDGEQLSESYKKVLQQTTQLEQIMRSTGLEQQQFLQNVADIRSNVEFINQLNQVYTYVQLPLKLSGQNANGDLYVYTNKKNLNDPDTELSAFLHLDLEHLGATDVSVKMLRKNVKTNFYFSDDASYELVKKNLPILEAKLNKKGYNCTFTVSNEDKKVDFVQDFLRKDLPVTGALHRYSFDVRT
ncbi:MAG: flagellar hook-length control protein FliK [Roseburia sp.]|nr:flagellar hook-length control protein FliK [Roseburia sp.]